MDAPCKIQGSIHVFRLVNNMCPGKWVHIIIQSSAFVIIYQQQRVYIHSSECFHLLYLRSLRILYSYRL